MAHSNDSIITGKLRGELGKELVFRNWDGKTVVAKAPRARKKGPVNAILQERQDKFQMATIYAKNILQDEDMKAGYSAVLRVRQTPYIRAVQDFMSPPVVTIINTQQYAGNIGDIITIRAKDDFRVKELRVEIHDTNGALLEKGNAVQHVNGIDWQYSATTANSAVAGSSVKAVATDVPGNEGEKEVILL